MKAVILAGGLGTRISEETNVKPKPMIEIGGMPILWHIMKIYSHYGVNEFIICCGYKGYIIKEFFSNYFLHRSDITFNIKENSVEIHKSTSENWKVTLVDTGIDTMTGGRIKKIKKYVENDNCFCMTYGDGLANINITDLINFHKKSNLLATVTATYPPGRFGSLDIKENKVVNFMEKPKGDGALINGGFFVLSPKTLDLIEGDKTIWEREPMESLAKNLNLGAYIFEGYWQPMDTLRDKLNIEELWEKGDAPWKVWDE